MRGERRGEGDLQGHDRLDQTTQGNTQSLRGSPDGILTARGANEDEDEDDGPDAGFDRLHREVGDGV